MTRHRRPSRRDAPARRAALVVAGLVAVTPVGMSTTSAGAAPTDPSDLRLSDVTGARLARDGTPAQVRATVTNDGAESVVDARVRYRLPDGVTFVPASSDPGCVAVAPIVTCTAGTLPPAGSATVAIGVALTDERAPLGSRAGWFLPPTSAGLDIAAGEVVRRTWFHEAGREGSPLAECWPVTNPAPAMDVAGGDCDGIVDAPAADPDEIAVLDGFPPPFSESLVRSWEFETQIVAPATGSYHACGVDIDDGGFLVATPVGTPITPAAIRLQTDQYETRTGPAFPLEGGRAYRVIMRVANRGSAGVDNGADGGTLAGWTAYGIGPASEACGEDDAVVFGSADTAWVRRVPADVVVVGASDLRILGAVESASVDGVRTAAVRVANVGPDPAEAEVAVELPAGAAPTAPLTGCDRDVGPVDCILDLAAVVASDPPAPDSGRVVALAFTGPAGAGWRITPRSTIDPDPSGNLLPPR